MEKALDEVFCTSCGKSIKKEAAYCVSCGVANAATLVQPANAVAGSIQRIPKDKTTAILLAVFLGFWTWIYTYQRDAWKFWLNLVLSIVLLIVLYPVVAWIWAIIDVAVKPESYYTNFPSES